VFCRNTHRDAPAHTNSAHTHTHTHTHTQTNTRMRAHKCHASHTKFVHTKATNEFTDNTHTHFWMYFAPTHRRLNFHFPLNMINLRISSSSSAQFSPRPVSLHPPRPLPMFLFIFSYFVIVLLRFHVSSTDASFLFCQSQDGRKFVKTPRQRQTCTPDRKPQGKDRLHDRLYSLIFSE